MTLAADEPELVPARMVNEAAYCPRLFFLEWVQARFVDNSDTVDGRWRHRVVDRPSGDLPSPQDEARPRVARSVTLSSPRLGLIGKADLLEATGGHVVPVDYKRGRVPDLPERAYEPERVQLCVHGLLLRDNGYDCDHGVLYFAESKERVAVPFTDQLVERTLEVVEELRRVAASDLAPPPLLDSPKCPRCSLVGICLPDEHNRLLGRTARPPRRLIPSDDAAKPLYVTEQGASVGVSGGRLEIKVKREVVASVRMLDVSQLSVFGNVQVSTQALRRCFAEEVLVCYFSSGGWLQGVADGLPSKHVELRRRQVIVAANGALPIARAIVEGKIRNSRTLLRRNARESVSGALDALAEGARTAASAESAGSLLGMEGAAARSYFSTMPAMLRTEAGLPGGTFSFESRNRRPPTDAVNCLLSFVYALLVKDLVATCIGVGLDPYIGVYHRPRYGRPALALDLAEEFRPLVGDSVVINVINNGEVKPSDFVVRAGGVALTSDGRRAVISAYERRIGSVLTHPMFGYKVTYRRALEVQARLLAAVLLGELPSYVPLTTR